MRLQFEEVLPGCVVQRDGADLLVCALHDADGSTVFLVLGGGGFTTLQGPRWPVAGTAGIGDARSAAHALVAVASDGRTWERSSVAKVERLGRLPGGDSFVNRLVTLSDAIWACGMDRQVWRRDGVGTWSEVSAPRSASGICGFTGLCEPTPGQLVAVGWQGELWCRTAGGWAQELSPSRSNFNSVSAGPDGEVVVVGDRGALVVGRPGEWLAHDTRTDVDFQGVCHFADEIFLCTDRELFRLLGRARGGRRELVRETRFQGTLPATCMNLLTGVSSVCAQGEQNLFRFHDGLWDTVL